MAGSCPTMFSRVTSFLGQSMCCRKIAFLRHVPKFLCRRLSYSSVYDLLLAQGVDDRRPGSPFG